MSDLGPMIWLIATAVMIVTVLTVGTLGAADLLPVRRDDETDPRPARRERTS